MHIIPDKEDSQIINSKGTLKLLDCVFTDQQYLYTCFLKDFAVLYPKLHLMFWYS